MKKLAALVLTVSTLVSLTACTPKLSTSETCVELSAIIHGIPDDPTEEQEKETFKEMDKLSGRASDSLKGVISDISFANQERLKPVDEQDTEKIDAAQERIDAKSDMVEEVCDL